MSPITQYIIYPLIVGGVITLLGLSVKYIGRYFNKLNSTLVTLDKSINAFILEQAQIHSDQEKKIELLESGFTVEKCIRVKHGEDIGRLYKKVGEHDTEIEVIKTKI